MPHTAHFIDHSHALSSAVGDWLEKRGFDLANSLGHATETGDPDLVGILKEDRTIWIRRYLFLGRRLRRFFGVIWLENAARGATRRHWVFEVHGKAQAWEAYQLADELRRSFDVQISIRVTHGEEVEQGFILETH